MRSGARYLISTVLLAFVVSCGRGGDPKEKLAQIRVWEDQGWTANGRLTGFLSDGNEAVRARAALALGRVDDTLTIDSLKRVLLDDPSPKVRANAAFAYGIWTWKIAKAPLLQALAREKDPDVLVMILESLGRVYARDEYQNYFPFLHHPDARVRAQAALTLDMLNRREATDSILPLLDDPEAAVRSMAVFSLVRMYSDKAAHAGLRFVADPDPFVRGNAYRLVGSARFPERNPTLLKGLEDPDPLVRCSVADALLSMRDSSFANPAIRYLRTDPSPLVVQRLLRAMAEIPQLDSAEAIRSLLSHPDPTIRAQAVTALCNRRDRPCWDDILSAADDPDWRVRSALFDVVDKISRFGMEVDLTPLVPVAGKLLNDPSPRVRSRALQAYVTFTMPNWDRELNRLYHDTSATVVGMAISLIGSMHINVYVDSLYQLYPKYSSDPEPDVKWALMAASANMLPSIEIDSLRQDMINWGLADPNRLVRWYTIAVALKFRQDRRKELGVYLTDLTPANIDSLLPVYAAPPRARLETTRGTIVIELNADVAPRAVRRFIDIARKGLYDGTPVREVQGGQLAALGDRWGDESSLPPPDVRDEYSPLRVEAGSVLWSTTVRDSGRGAFLLTLSRLPYQDWRVPVFGKIVDGLDVAKNLTLADSIRTVTILTGGS